MDNKGKIASGLVGVILAHHIADVVKQPLDESTVPQPMTVMVVSSTLASSSIGAVVMTSNTITDERIAAPLLWRFLDRAGISRVKTCP